MTINCSWFVRVSGRGVCLTFIFGFVLLIICCIFFFLGANAQKICQSLGGPQYSVFRQVSGRLLSCTFRHCLPL